MLESTNLTNIKNREINFEDDLEAGSGKKSYRKDRTPGNWATGTLAELGRCSTYRVVKSQRPIFLQRLIG